MNNAERAERERIIHEVRSDIDENAPYPLFPKQIKKWSPQVFALFFGRKYILPQFRVVDYFKQDFLNFTEWSNLQYYPLADANDEVLRSAFACSAIAMQHKRPTLFLERELGEPLLRTSPPLDMQAEEIKWKWPAIRIYLPKGLLTLIREECEHSLMYLDIARLPGDIWHRVPEQFGAELDRYLDKMHPEVRGHVKLSEFRFKYPDTAIICSGMIEKGSKNIGLTTYGLVKPFSHYTLQHLKDMTDQLQTEWKSDPIDKVFLEKMELLAINILLFLSAYPMEYTPDDKNVIRKPRLEGSNHLPGLYPAKFVGRSQIRPSAKGPHHVAGMMTSEEYHLKSHWRCGHWKRQHYGVKFSETKLIWINPYQAGLLEEESKKQVKS